MGRSWLQLRALGVAILASLSACGNDTPEPTLVESRPATPATTARPADWPEWLIYPRPRDPVSGLRVEFRFRLPSAIPAHNVASTAAFVDGLRARKGKDGVFSVTRMLGRYGQHLSTVAFRPHRSLEPTVHGTVSYRCESDTSSEHARLVRLVVDAEKDGFPRERVNPILEDIRERGDLRLVPALINALHGLPEDSRVAGAILFLLGEWASVDGAFVALRFLSSSDWLVSRAGSFAIRSLFYCGQAPSFGKLLRRRPEDARREVEAWLASNEAELRDRLGQ